LISVIPIDGDKLVIGVVSIAQFLDFNLILSILTYSFTFLFSVQIIIDQEEIIPIKICSICRRGVYSKKKLFICPFCTSSFHHSHLDKWLAINNSCPVCKTSFRSYNIWCKPNTNYLAISMNRKENSDQFSPVISHSRSPIRNERSKIHRMNTEEIKEAKKINVIGALLIFFLIINQINKTLALIGSVILIPILLPLFIKWAIFYVRGWIRWYYHQA
jgi:hypothetical protein